MENIDIFRIINEDKIDIISQIFEKKNTEQKDIINEICKYIIPNTIDEIIDKWTNIRKKENLMKETEILNIRDERLDISILEKEQNDTKRNNEKSQQIIKWLIDNKKELSEILSINQEKLGVIITKLCIQSDNIYLYKIISKENKINGVYAHSMINNVGVYNERRKYREDGDIMIKIFENGYNNNYMSFNKYSYRYMSFQLYTAIKSNSMFLYKYLINKGHRIPLKMIIEITDNFRIFEYLENILNIKWNNVHLNYCCNLHNDKIFDYLFYEKKAKIKLYPAISQSISNISTDFKSEIRKIYFLNKIIGLFQKNHLNILSFLLYKKFNSSFVSLFNLLSLDNPSYYFDHNLINIAIKNSDLSTLTLIHTHHPKLYNSFILHYCPTLSLEILKYLCQQCKIIIPRSFLIYYSPHISLDILKFLLEDCKISLPDASSFFVSCFISQRRDICSYLNHRYNLVDPYNSKHLIDLYHSDFIYTI